MPDVDVVVLTRTSGALLPEVEEGIRRQRGVQSVLHRIVGLVSPTDRSSWETIARARNQGKACGSAPWLMFVDDDVVLEDGCIRH